MEDNPKAPESNGLEELVALMQENNKSTAEIERDGRNTRRHLLEMKKIQQASLDMSDSVNIGFENFFETMNANKLADEESANERASIFEEIRDELTSIREGGLDTRSDESSSSGGGRMGGIGKLLGGAGIGIGAAAAGIAAVFASSSFLLDTLENMDGKKIVANVKDLLEIANLPGEKGDSLRVMGTLGAIGIGLAAFGIGAFFAKAASDETAQEVKKAVGTYLSIAQLPGEEGDSARVMGTLAALGTGLIAFGVGSFFANAASEDQANVVKQSVASLLGIADLNTEGANEVMKALAQIGGGLVAFGVGSFFAKASGDGQGEQIRQEVESLLKISEDPNADPARVEVARAALKTLGGGLTGFGVGSFFAKAVGEGSGEKIRQEVSSLLSIADDPNASLEGILKATGALTALGGGLTAFGAGSFVSSLGAAAGAVLDFFSGSKSPIEQAMELGENADVIDAGVNSLTMFREELNRFSDMGSISSDLGLEEMAEDLLAASKLIKIAVDGGTDFRGINTDYVGLANVKGIEESVASINRLKGALNMEMSDGTSIDTNQNTTGAGLMTISAENVDLRTPNTPTQSTQVNTDASKSETMNQTIMLPTQQPDKVTESVASR